MIRLTDQYFWNFIFTVFFIILIVMGAIILETESRIPYSGLTFFDVALITLATFRLTHLIVFDSITKWFREQFYDAKVTKTKVTLHKPISGARRTFATLINNTWSAGLFSAGLITFFYLLTDYAYFPVLILAVAGIATVLQNMALIVSNKIE